ncbi:hypothetical protein [Halobellus rufus]|uniref:hypothetical protein n=1 Tax=Halobellus rufus TaxID=1448860 RepID=UPI00067847B3|nr:hypothetical protein [Halobellus rufus]
MAARQADDYESPFSASAWAHQDGLRVHDEHYPGRSHVGRQWDRRCRSGWENYPIRVAWREAVPISYSDGDEVAARLHDPAAVVVIARLGVIKTVIPAADADVELPEVEPAEHASTKRNAVYGDYL